VYDIWNTERTQAASRDCRWLNLPSHDAYLPLVAQRAEVYRAADAEQARKQEHQAGKAWLSARQAEGINPKDLLQQRQDKVPLGLIPPVAKEAQARVHQFGAFLKKPEAYGPYNWRNYEVLLSVYCDAAERHIDEIRRGVWLDPESKQPHAAHANACMNIIVDAKHVGKLVDDLKCKDPEPAAQAPDLGHIDVI
jgi:dATP/dGTP diphosphohydrolase, N-terminal